MTGAAIVRWWEGDTLVLSVHGAFDGASAWALRIEMDEAGAREVVIDLANAEEACDFAACLLAAYARERRRDRTLGFRSGDPACVRLLRAHGLDAALDEGGRMGGAGPGVPLRAPEGVGSSLG